MAAHPAAASDHSSVQRETLFGHPVGLYTLFFAEMWERFSYYGMRALLVFYMIKGFLGYGDQAAYAVYGAYTALVYATGFVGGMFADRLLGQRRAVILGGLLMAAGHLMMTVEHVAAFYHALALLIVGNGFFKPNISTIVGKLYAPKSPRRDGGFTIFYMGVNLGAALSPLVCGYVGETYEAHWGFGLATIGMLAGLAVFVAPTRVTQAIILTSAVTTAGSMLFLQDDPYRLTVNILIGGALVVAGILSCIALNRGGLPEEAGAPPNPAALARKIGPLPTYVVVYLGVLASVPVFALLVRRNEIAQWILYSLGAASLAWLVVEAMRRTKIERERLLVVLVLILFSILFWAFFEQAGSSLNNFADRNIDRVMQDRVVSNSDVGSDIRFRIPFHTDDESIAELPMLTQEQLGQRNVHPELAQKVAEAIRIVESNRPGRVANAEEISALIAEVNKSDVLNLTSLTALRDAAKSQDVNPELRSLTWRIGSDNVGMGIGGSEVPASTFQSVNAGFILVFGVPLTMLWTILATRGLEPSTPIKFALGLFQLGLGFVAFWYGAQQADERGMVTMFWLFLGYLFHTTGELCLSPVGLSMVTKLSPKQVVSTTMGAWFMATGIANYLAGKIAALTALGQEGEGPQIIPPPAETVNTFGDVYGLIALWTFGAAIACLALSPLLTKWMHQETFTPDQAVPPDHA
jgi:POT family proton-dependent oligopeptide transporter